MLIELPPADHERLRPLFAAFGPRLHGCIEAVFSGGFGTAWADDPASPRVAIARIDFWFVAGGPTTPAAREALRLVTGPGTIVTDGGPFHPLVRETLVDRVHEQTRIALTTPHAWDRNSLREMAASLPPAFAIRRVTAHDIDAFAAIERDLIANFRTPQRFLDRGVGFGVWHGERCVAGCSSFTLANSKLEIEIDTHPDYRRRGLARAVAATMILHCLGAGLEPCWDAHNPDSAALALQLGFTDPQPYTVFRVG